MGSRCMRGNSGNESHSKSKFFITRDYQQLQGQTVGQGCLTTPAWKATITKAQLQTKREEFWRTRQNGHRHIWLALKQAIEADHETAATLLNMASIMMAHGTVSLCHDLNGNPYQIPAAIINDPIEFSDSVKQSLPPPKKLKKETIEVKMRRMGIESDFKTSIDNMVPVASLKQVYAVKAGVEAGKLRLFFNGKELKNQQTLASYYIQSEMVVQVLVSA